MSAVHPLFILSGVLFLILSPCLALFGIAVYRVAKESPSRGTDSKLKAKMKALEIQKEEMVAQYEDAKVGANQMIDRIRLLERLLIEERRQRLAESTEILSLRDYAQRLENRLRSPK